MEIINTLDPSAPEPKKKRVRKPRAKPPPKAAANVCDTNGVAEKNSKDKEDVSSKSKLKKSGPESTAHVPESPNISSKEKTASSTLPPEKQTLFKMYMSLLTPHKENTTDEPEPKKKKKESETREDDRARVSEQTVEKIIKEKKTKSAKPETEKNDVEQNANFCTEPAVEEKTAKKRKKEKTRSEESSAETAEKTKVKTKKKTVDSETNKELNSAEEINTDQTVANPKKTGIEERLEEKVKQKKVKKKKEKVVCEEILEAETVEAQENIEQKVEDEENPELIVKKKKAKKKKKESADVENNPEEVQEVKEKEKNHDESTSEQIDKEKSKKKHKSSHTEAISKHTHKDFKSTPEKANCVSKHEHVQHLSVEKDLEESNQETMTPKKKKSE